MARKSTGDPMTAGTALVARLGDQALAGPLGSLDAYLDRVSRIPVLSREEERALAVRFRSHGDLDAARHLVLSHLRFVVHIARGYSGYGLPVGDLIQEGNVGLMKAVKRFDPTLNVRLVSFAVHWIRAEIHEYVLRNWRLVKIATTKAQRKLFFNLRRLKKNLAWLSAEETAAVARDLGVTPSEVTEMEQRLAARDLSFDPAPEGDDEESYSPAAYLPAPDPDPAASVEDAESADDNTARLQGALGRLDARSRDIVERRWMSEDHKATLHELAEKYGVSAERIRQIESSALGKLRGLMAAA
jgi:RNA polymerase sigma-32 factor